MDSKWKDVDDVPFEEAVKELGTLDLIQPEEAMLVLERLLIEQQIFNKALVEELETLKMAHNSLVEEFLQRIPTKEKNKGRIIEV